MRIKNKTNKTITQCFALLFSFAVLGCENYYDTVNDPIVYGETYLNIEINSDKACYKPGETVHFSLSKRPDGNVKVRYSHLGETISEESLAGTTWQWTPPTEDYKGYLVSLYSELNGEENILHSIAVDVSSDWAKFPRYGFFSEYGKLSETEMAKNVNYLNRFHINGVQFYDWMYDHQRPLAGTVAYPDATWPDLIGRTNYMSTVKGYIDGVHQKGMKAMFYNLAFGALNNAAADGVKEEWYMFKDSNRGEKDNHHLDAPFRSSIYLTNPANTEWQAYLVGRHNDVYSVFDFDGYHIDQLGNRGSVYDYNGNRIDLENAYLPFVTAMKQAQPNKRLVMNAVSQYGQEQSISKSAVDFLYTEVWDEARSFSDLADVLLNNHAYSNGTKQTVLAAYMNYAKSSNRGFINAPGILLTNAVIFSFGGSHLELGEHYLANEYFPNSNLQMKSETQQALVNYYDFLVAYQNLLRDGGTFASINVESADGAALSFENWPASQGSVAVLGKKFADREVIYLMNFSEANSMEWRDTNGTQKEPTTRLNVQVKIAASSTVKKAWFASPDYNGGVAQSLQFSQSGSDVTLTLPSLKYWDMIVLEY